MNNSFFFFNGGFMCGSGVDLLGAGQWDFSDLYIIWFIFGKSL